MWQWPVPQIGRLTLPTIAVDSEPPVDRDWQLTKTGLTLLRLPVGQFEMDDEGEKQPVTSRRDFWLADREVSVNLSCQLAAASPVGDEQAQREQA